MRYLEYDWVAGPGNFIYETPGLVHTLVSDHPNGVKLFGWLQGPLEFYDDNGNFVETVDVWWFINHYESYCREQGHPSTNSSTCEIGMAVTDEGNAHEQVDDLSAGPLGCGCPDACAGTARTAARQPRPTCTRQSLQSAVDSYWPRRRPAIARK